MEASVEAGPQPQTQYLSFEPGLEKYSVPPGRGATTANKSALSTLRVGALGFIRLHP